MKEFVEESRKKGLQFTIKISIFGESSGGVGWQKTLFLLINPNSNMATTTHSVSPLEEKCTKTCLLWGFWWVCCLWGFVFLLFFYCCYCLFVLGFF